MAQTLLKRETFAAEVNSGSPGVFATVYGNCYPMKGGGLVRAWETPGTASPANKFIGEFTLNNVNTGGTALPIWMLGGWFRFTRPNATNFTTDHLFDLDTQSAPGNYATQFKVNWSGKTCTPSLLNLLSGTVTPGVSRTWKLWEWVYLGFAGSCTPASGSQPVAVRAYVRRLTDANPVLVSSYDLASYFAPANFLRIFTWAGATNLEPPSYQVQNLSLYKLDALADAATYPADLPIPDGVLTGKRTFLMNAATGSDSNNGVDAAWATWARAIQATRTGEFAGAPDGGYFDTPAGTARATPNTDNTEDAWVEDWDDGKIVGGGDVLEVTASTPLRMANTFPIPDGAEIRGSNRDKWRVWFTASAGSSFTQPNSGTYPNVWKLAGSQIDKVLYDAITSAGRIDLVQYALHFAANAAAALPLVNATPGTCWPDPTGDGILFRPWSGNNPTTDGVQREISAKPTETDVNGYFTGDGIVSDLDCDGGLIYNSDSATGTDDVLGGSYSILSQVTTGVAVWRRCLVRGGGKHRTIAAGDTNAGFLFRDDLEVGWAPASVATTQWTCAGVDYTGVVSATGATRRTWWRGVSVSEAIRIAGQVAGTNATSYEAILSHANAAAIIRYTYENCYFPGASSLSNRAPAGSAVRFIAPVTASLVELPGIAAPISLAILAPSAERAVLNVIEPDLILMRQLHQLGESESVFDPLTEEFVFSAANGESQATRTYTTDGDGTRTRSAVTRP